MGQQRRAAAPPTPFCHFGHRLSRPTPRVRARRGSAGAQNPERPEPRNSDPCFSPYGSSERPGHKTRSRPGNFFGSSRGADLLFPECGGETPPNFGTDPDPPSPLPSSSFPPPPQLTVPARPERRVPAEGFRSPVAQLTGLLSSYREASARGPRSPGPTNPHRREI